MELVSWLVGSLVMRSHHVSEKDILHYAPETNHEDMY
jgi:hypothetical protein